MVYVEIMFDPQSHTDRGVPFAYVVDGISKALGDAEQKLGITGSLIMSFLRHLGPDRAVSTLKEVMKSISPFVLFFFSLQAWQQSRSVQIALMSARFNQEGSFRLPVE